MHINKPELKKVLFDNNSDFKPDGISKRVREVTARECYGVLIKIEDSERKKIIEKLRYFLLADERIFLKGILKVALTGSAVIKTRFKSQKFNRYISELVVGHNFAFEYELSEIINKNLSMIQGFIDSGAISRQLYIPVFPEKGDAMDPWPPSMLGFHVLNITGRPKVISTNFSAFSRSLDIDFLRVDLLYYLEIISHLYESISKYEDKLVGIDFYLHIANLYKENKKK